AAIIAEPTPLPSRPTVHRHYRPALLVALLLLVTVFGFALYQYQSVHRLRAIAVDMFYSMKALELQVLDLQQLVQAQLSANEEDEALASTLTDYREALAAQRQRLVELRQRYAEFMTRVNAARLALDSEERLILRVARAFGECDANAPEEFIAEVKRYIDLWQTTRRLPRAIQRLQANGYAPAIIRALKARNLPPQFLYLALQESEFRTEAVGPATDYGHAKGMWQFIPETGLRYGLNPGPRMGEKAYDPADERHDFVKSTRAAARYLSDLYRTEAQASGLLVMASYNWGEGNILSLLDSLPANPLQRNFWTLLQHHAIPRETYDYVFYIVAAAAIGENPALFGFEFENPLTGYDAPVLTSEWEGSRAARAGLEH
ncbi:MAG: lytic transglycosylase domain-containing protein, partial [Candidatus Competibacterales bacterium]|nr:lytic transglycosylase domain-containing protein [Candidatus Competibacterales bacterium]